MLNTLRAIFDNLEQDVKKILVELQKTSAHNLD